MKHGCHLRAVGLSARFVMDLTTKVGLASWDEATNLEHTDARDLLSQKATCNYPSFLFFSAFVCLFLQGWSTKAAVSLPVRVGVNKQCNLKDALLDLWNCVSRMVQIARDREPRQQAIREFAEAAKRARRLWRALNTDGAAGNADSPWRPTVWTHVFLWHLPSVLEKHGTLYPFWQYGFENRHSQKKQGLVNTMHAGGFAACFSFNSALHFFPLQKHYRFWQG